MLKRKLFLVLIFSMLFTSMLGFENAFAATKITVKYTSALTPNSYTVTFSDKVTQTYTLTKSLIPNVRTTVKFNYFNVEYSAYVTYKAPTVKSAIATSTTSYKVTFSDKVTQTYTLTKSLIPNVRTTVKFNYFNVEYSAYVTYKAPTLSKSTISMSTVDAVTRSTSSAASIKVTDTVVIDSRTVKVTFSDGKTIIINTTGDITPNIIYNINFSYLGNTYTQGVYYAKSFAKVVLSKVTSRDTYAITFSDGVIKTFTLDTPFTPNVPKNVYFEYLGNKYSDSLIYAEDMPTKMVPGVIITKTYSSNLGECFIESNPNISNIVIISDKSYKVVFNNGSANVYSFSNAFRDRISTSVYFVYNNKEYTARIVYKAPVNQSQDITVKSIQALSSTKYSVLFSDGVVKEYTLSTTSLSRVTNDVYFSYLNKDYKMALTYIAPISANTKVEEETVKINKIEITSNRSYKVTFSTGVSREWNTPEIMKLNNSYKVYFDYLGKTYAETLYYK